MFIEVMRIDKLNEKTYPITINVESIEVIEPDVEEPGKTLITCKSYYAQVDESYESVKFKIRTTLESQRNQSL